MAELAPKELHINQFLERSISWITRAIPENIKIETVLADDLRSILIDESALESALLNLIINARDAMPDGGGHILIKTQNVRVADDDNNPRFRQIVPGDYVELTVGDSGTGISESEQEKIFEPFCSTKSQRRIWSWSRYGAGVYEAVRRCCSCGVGARCWCDFPAIVSFA